MDQAQAQLEGTQGNILIVDDTPDNLHLLSRILTRQGYEVRAVVSGKMALTVAQMGFPEVILLDISMPEMDGYEVCRRLKADDRTQDIPVIFLSALGETQNKLQAFEVGGVDYVTKPFQTSEVLARVEVHLRLQRLQRQLQHQNLQLQQEMTARQKAEEKYRSIFENCVEGIFQRTPEGHYLSVNPAFARIYGYRSVNEFLNATLEGSQKLYVRPGRAEELQAYLRQYGQVGEFESEAYRRDGSHIWISETVREIRDSNGELLHYEGTVQDITERRLIAEDLRRQRQQTEQLLLSILPQTIAERLKRKQETIADSFDDVTVLFGDVVNFTTLATQMPPTSLVELLNLIFTSFDQLAQYYGLEKIKTIGDAYMVAGGVPTPQVDHVFAVADMALAMQQKIKQFQADTGESFQLRIGIHTGPVVAGVIGRQKFSYDLWGNTVNLASRMQTQAEPGMIQVTSTTRDRLCLNYYLEERGSITVKGVGSMTTYWLQGKK